MADQAQDADDKKPSKGKDIVAEAQERFEKAKDAFGANRALAIQDTKFVLGDSDNGWQWPEDIFRQRSTVEKRPCLTVNITAQHCNQIINNIRQNRPQCKVLPGDARAAKKAAEIYAGMIRGIQAASHADVAHDTAAEHAIYGGEGYWVISTDYESPTSFNQSICILPVENPQLVLIDPFCGMNKLKAQWGFLFEEISKEEAKRLYGKDGVDPSTWANESTSGWYSDKTVRVAKYYYSEQVEDTLYLLPDGTTALASELKAKAGDDAVKQAEAVAAAIEQQTGGKAKRTTTRTAWKYCKLVGGHDEPLEQKDWPGSYLPIIQVVGKEVNVNGEIVRKGVVRDIKDPARMVNYSYSGAVETVALQNKIPYIAAAEAIEGYEDQWGVANQSTASYLPYNQFDEQGNKLDRPARQEPAVMPAAQVQMLQLSTEQMRAASGQQNSNFGIKSEAASGVGIQRLKVQGETATFHFPDNLARALHDEAVILIDLIPKVYDTRRVVQLLGIDGKDDKAVLDPDMDGAYAEYTGQDVKVAFNPLVGKYDVAIDTGPSYQTQRQEGSDRMMELTARNPQMMQIAGDLVMQAMDFPYADKLAERFKKTLPPALQDHEGQPQIPPEVQAHLQQADQLIQQMHAELAQLHQELAQAKSGEAQKFNEVLVKAYAAETDRAVAFAGAMTPEQVHALATQAALQAMAQQSPVQPPGNMPMPPDPGLMQQQPQQAPPGAFSLPDHPPAMAATGAYPGPGTPPVLPEGTTQ
jgi:hypothetical protein